MLYIFENGRHFAIFVHYNEKFMKRIIISLFLIISFPGLTLIAGEQYIYTRLSNRDGLPSSVTSIYKEKGGIVWLGTSEGLFKFNGHDLRQNEDPLLKNRIVLKIEEDKEGNIWVLTDDWLMYRRKGEEGFTHLTAESHRKETPFYSMCQDDDGIWFGSYGSIYRYTFKDRNFTRFCQPEGLEHFTCIFLNKIDDSTLLCSSNLGTFLVNTGTGGFTRTVLGPIKEVSCTLTDSKGRLWIAFYNHGIKVFGKDGTLLKTYSTKNSSLSNDIIICFTEKDSKIWAGTDGGGINIIDPETDSIRILAHIPGESASFPAHSLKSLYTDNHGNVWAGTTRDGLVMISQSYMKTYQDSHIGLQGGLSNKTVLCLFQEEDDHTIWVGTDCEGLNRFDPETNRFTHYEQTLKTKIISVATYSETELALSVYMDGIWLFNKNTGAVRPLEINDNELKHAIRHIGRRVIIANGKNNDIYFLKQEVHKYDRKTGLCHLIPVQEGVRSRGHMYIIGTTDRGLYFHDTNGIYRVDEEAGVLLQLAVADDNVIRSGYPGKDGDIWLATKKGLCRFDEDSGKLSYMSTGLFTEASAVVCDRQSRVWIGSGSHLYAYLIEEDSFAMFGESDGALLNEYQAKPRLLSNEGDVYLGGVQGLLRIDKDYTIDASEVPSISLYNISADKERIYADEDGIYEVPRDSKILSISVSTRETDIFRHKMYRFSIAGSGKEYELMSPTVEIRDFPDPGKYDVLVSCTKRNGDWTEPSRIMTLRIPRPWYLSGWFIIGVLALILIAAGSIAIGLMYRKASRLQLALKEQEQMVYEEKVRMLINISHELRTPLTLIMAPLKRLLSGTAPQQEHTATLHRIYRQSKRMKNLLDMVLDLRKLEVGKSGLKMEKADFNGWLNSTVEDIVNEENAEGIHISTELDPGIGAVDFDKKKCETVLLNILMNAIKHSSKGDTILIRTSFTDTGNVRVSISDEGPGLSDMDRSKLFTRFYQSNSEEYGSGIGLSYSKILVELQGGCIGAENNEVRGATFWWEIPVSSAGLSEVPDKAYLNELMDYSTAEDPHIPDSNGFSTAGLSLMLVDDSQDLLDFLREALTGEFAEIITATGGNKALSIISGGKMPDIIVSDVNMPDGDGYSLCARLKGNEKYSHIPIVLLTARGEQQSQSDSYKVGADAFMAKPFEVETLTELLKGLLRKRNEIRRKYLDNEEKAATDYGSNEESFIIKLNRIISENLDNPDLDQQLLCREMGLSRASLFNKMKSITGAGAKEYITKLRLEKAKKLIIETDLSIAEVSDQTGFASQSYFSTAFKNHTGLTPSQYKQENRK